MSARKDDGGPAFPLIDQRYMANGMSLRDWFAGQALAGLLSDPLIRDTPEGFAKSCYERADAMIAERSKQ